MWLHVILEYVTSHTSVIENQTNKIHEYISRHFFSICLGSTTKPPSDNGPTDGGRKENSSWVMPFFIASMAFLLFLFLAFVIGIVIWCHMQTRNRQNVIIQAEDPQVVQRLTKPFDDPEPICCMQNKLFTHPSSKARISLRK